MKQSRHQKIKELLSERPIETQEELVQLLSEAGYKVTQATASRDIRELNLTKVLLPDGRQTYAFFDPERRKSSDAHVRLLQDNVLSTALAGNLLVVKTAVGMGMACAAALEGREFPELVGCIGGDDTIFLAVRSTEDGKRLDERIHNLLEN